MQNISSLSNAHSQPEPSLFEQLHKSRPAMKIDPAILAKLGKEPIPGLGTMHISRLGKNHPLYQIPQSILAHTMTFLAYPPKDMALTCKSFYQAFQDLHGWLLAEWSKDPRVAVQQIPPVPLSSSSTPEQQRRKRDKQRVEATVRAHIDGNIIRAMPPRFTGANPTIPDCLPPLLLARIEHLVTPLREKLPLSLTSIVHIADDANCIRHFEPYLRKFLELEQKVGAPVSEFYSSTNKDFLNCLEYLTNESSDESIAPPSAATLAQIAATLRTKRPETNNIFVQAQSLIDCFERLQEEISGKDRPVLQGTLVEQAKTIRTWMKANSQILDQIRYLNLSALDLLNLPPEIAGLQNLRSLHLSNNYLVSLPSEIGNLQALRFLDLENNQLDDLPPVVAALKNLKHLSLAHNQLRRISSKIIHGLPRLHTLHIYENPFTTWPTDLDRPGLSIPRK